MATLRLREMKNSQSGSIISINTSGELGRRIREMGLVPGVTITVCGKAPLQDPVAIRVLNSTLTLRNNEADHIRIEHS